ncbi:MAG TPA: NAD(P)/FAD-dependent oxidoreductase [Gaiellaceae bacterium]|nr:NAD(P)/FAD-dependent oxidoreductase [Gaiellaceae bacterium]
MESFDLIVIGGGGAAREAATRAASDHRASVAVIERERWGGSCANVACKPTKQLVAAAGMLKDLRAVGDDLGIQADRVEFSLAALKARKDWLIGSQEAWRERFAEAFTAIDGEASFVDAHDIVVGERKLTSDRILIATGSRTAVPPIPGLDDVPWVDNIGLLDVTELPESLLVMGGGAVGLEFAQAFARFGSRVTLVEGGERIAPRSDADAAAELTATLRGEGIEVVTSTFVTRFERDGAAALATLSPRDGSPERMVPADLVLVAVGRRPNIEDLALERAGVASAPAGINVDDRMRTNVEGIWAAGDVVVAPQFTPVGAEQAQVAVEDMFGDGARRVDYAILPNAIFTDPELAAVGLTEEEARMQGFDVETSSYTADGILRSYYTLPRDATPRGLVKIVYERGSRRLLGVHALVRGGAELVQGYAVAMRLGATVDDVADTFYAFPTMGEAVHYTAESALAGATVAG